MPDDPHPSEAGFEPCGGLLVAIETGFARGSVAEARVLLSGWGYLDAVARLRSHVGRGLGMRTLRRALLQCQAGFDLRQLSDPEIIDLCARAIAAGRMRVIEKRLVLPAVPGGDVTEAATAAVEVARREEMDVDVDADVIEPPALALSCDVLAPLVLEIEADVEPPQMRRRTARAA